MDLFSVNENKCPICYSDLYIHTYIKSCQHIYCLCCILRWVNKSNACPLCRQRINHIGFFTSESKKKSIIINSGDFEINQNDDILDCKDRQVCIICGKNEPSNKLVLCLKCKFSLTHINCGSIDLTEIQNFCFKNAKINEN